MYVCMYVNIIRYTDKVHDIVIYIQKYYKYIVYIISVLKQRGKQQAPRWLCGCWGLCFLKFTKNKTTAAHFSELLHSLHITIGSSCIFPPSLEPISPSQLEYSYQITVWRLPLRISMSVFNSIVSKTYKLVLIMQATMVTILLLFLFFTLVNEEMQTQTMVF